MNPNTTESFESIFKRQEQSIGFWEEMAIIEFTEAVLEWLHLREMSKTDLAEKMNVSPAYIAKLIGGSNNFTLRTMVRVARSLGCELAFQLRPTETCSHWLPYNISTPTPLFALSNTMPKQEARFASTERPAGSSENEELFLAA